MTNHANARHALPKRIAETRQAKLR
jgi:hypothetical protein